MTNIFMDLVVPFVTHTALAFAVLYIVCRVGEAIADAFKGDGS